MANTIHIDATMPVALIDTSYYIFHRYFATLRWYSFKSETETLQMCDCEPFMEAYFKHLQQDLVKYTKTFQLAAKPVKDAKPATAAKPKKQEMRSVNPILFLQDCPQSTIWRHQHHSSYKEGRKVSHKLDTRIFSKTYEWLTNNGHVLLRIPELEADDLAYLVKRAIREVSGQQSIFILTNDNDYIQLCDANCRCFNASLKEIATRGQYGGAMSPQTELRAKILLGDKSDCIDACVSKKRMESLLNSTEDELKQQMSAKEYSLYEINRRLIDLSQIPHELQERFQETFTFVVNCVDS